MLFRKRMPKSCEYCSWGTKIDDHQILCVKRGVVADSYACRKFTYDACKRIPKKAKALDLGKYKESDFEL